MISRWVLPRWPGFNPRSGHVGFMVDKMVLEQIFFKYSGTSVYVLNPLVLQKKKVDIIRFMEHKHTNKNWTHKIQTNVYTCNIP
jgi:hypothetical protein